jgi:hypothetical protein
VVEAVDTISPETSPQRYSARPQHHRTNSAAVTSTWETQQQQQRQHHGQPQPSAHSRSLIGPAHPSPGSSRRNSGDDMLVSQSTHPAASSMRSVPGGRSGHSPLQPPLMPPNPPSFAASASLEQQFQQFQQFQQLQQHQQQQQQQQQQQPPGRSVDNPPSSVGAQLRQSQDLLQDKDAQLQAQHDRTARLVEQVKALYDALRNYRAELDRELAARVAAETRCRELEDRLAAVLSAPRPAAQQHAPQATSSPNGLLGIAVAASNPPSATNSASGRSGRPGEEGTNLATLEARVDILQRQNAMLRERLLTSSRDGPAAGHFSMSGGPYPPQQPQQQQQQQQQPYPPMAAYPSGHPGPAAAGPQSYYNTNNNNHAAGLNHHFSGSMPLPPPSPLRGGYPMALVGVDAAHLQRALAGSKEPSPR